MALYECGKNVGTSCIFFVTRTAIWYLGDWTKLSELVFSLIAGALARHFGCTLLAGCEIAVPLSQQSPRSPQHSWEQGPASPMLEHVFMKSRQSSIQFLQPNVLFELADDATGPKYNDLKVGRNRRGSVTVVFMLSFSEIRRSLRNALVLSNAIKTAQRVTCVSWPETSL